MSTQNRRQCSVFERRTKKKKKWNSFCPFQNFNFSRKVQFPKNLTNHRLEFWKKKFLMWVRQTLLIDITTVTQHPTQNNYSSLELLTKTCNLFFLSSIRTKPHITKLTFRGNCRFITTSLFPKHLLQSFYHFSKFSEFCNLPIHPLLWSLLS